MSELTALTERFLAAAEAEGLVDVAYDVVDAPFGPLLCAATPRGLVRVSFLPADDVLAELARKVSPRVLRLPARLDPVRHQLEEYFAGRRRSFDLALDWTLVRGPFQRRILDAAARIPYGATSTYTTLAAEAGNPKASRAAGNALGANPLCVVVPCHRVLRGDRSLGGYAGTLPRKEFLLRLEGAA